MHGKPADNIVRGTFCGQTVILKQQRHDQPTAAYLGDGDGVGRTGDEDGAGTAGMGAHTTGDGARAASGDGRESKRRRKDGNKNVRKQRKAAHASE